MSLFSIVMLVIGLPLVGSLLIPLLGIITRGKGKARPPSQASLAKGGEVFSLSLIGLAHLLTWTLLPAALRGETHRWVISLWPGFDQVILMDPLSVFMAMTASFLSLMIAIYAIDYMAKNEHLTEYYMMVTLFVGAMMGLVFSAHLVFLYIFWELSSFSSWRLISFYREKEYVAKGVKAFLITFFGAALMAIGFFMIYTQKGTFDLTELRGASLTGTAVLLIVIGMLSKSATLPFHTWLPDAGIAPSTVTSLLHAAVLVKIGVYAFARIFNFTFALDQQALTAIMLVGMVSAFVSACAALRENNIKRILAYSTISQLGYIFMGLASSTTIGIAGALLFILMHGIAKAGLFLTAGILEHGTGTKDIRKMGGLIKVMPLTAGAFFFCSLSIIGIPPFGGFFSKFMVVQGVVLSGHSWIGAMAILTAGLTLMYLLRAFTIIFLGKPLDASVKAHHEGSPVMVGVVVALAILSLGAGFLVHFPMELVTKAVDSMLVNPAVTGVVAVL